MVNVIGVRFENAGKLYFFDPGEFWPTPGDYVLVETSRGIEFGEVVTGIRELDDSTLQSPLKPVVRIASAEDLQHHKDNEAAEKEAYQICQKKISEHKLDMKLVSVEYTFDNSKILFYFTANGRVDFRSLVKDLAGVFKTRIELRQIGVRDEAKMLGGLGICGRPICCGTFLGDFQPVSIKMAKEQNLSLNPTKISGVCGRLMCCLKYEQDQYEQTRKKMPKVGKEVITPDGPGVVWELNVIKETVRVRIQKGDSSELKDYPMEEIQRPGASNARREDAGAAASDAVSPDEAPEVKPEAESKPHARKERPAREDRKPCSEEAVKASMEDAGEQHQPQEDEPADTPVEEGAAEAADDAPVQTPAEPEAPAVEEAPAEPAASAWKAALERAMKEAGNGGK